MAPLHSLLGDRARPCLQKQTNKKTRKRCRGVLLEAPLGSLTDMLGQHCRLHPRFLPVLPSHPPSGFSNRKRPSGDPGGCTAEPLGKCSSSTSGTLVNVVLCAFTSAVGPCPPRHCEVRGVRECAAGAGRLGGGAGGGLCVCAGGRGDPAADRLAVTPARQSWLPAGARKACGAAWAHARKAGLGRGPWGRAGVGGSGRGRGCRAGGGGALNVGVGGDLGSAGRFTGGLWRSL